MYEGDWFHKLGNPDVWIRTCKKDNGSECREYFLLYTDMCLVISLVPKEGGEDTPERKKSMI